ncbi:MAG: SpoIIE family protein phosphatase [Solirubrobacteraceae bacterium]
MLETLGEAVTIRDSGDALVYANRAALHHLGFETLAELQDQGLHAVMDEYIVHDEHGRRLTMADIPSVRLLHGERPEPLLLQSVHRVSGEARWELLKTAGLRDADGRPTVAITVIEDLTAVKTAEVHMRVLSESGRIFAASLDSLQTLRNVAEVAVPGLADWCVVDVLGSSGQRERVGTAHRDPARRALMAELRRGEPDPIDPTSTLGRVIRNGASELYTEMSEEYLVQVARSPAQLEALRALAIRSAMVIPMRVHSRTVGVMTFGTSEEWGRQLGEDDVALAEQLAARAAIAVENSRLHTTLRRVSETLQQSLLPQEPPEVPGWDIAALYRPAGESQRVEVGGDFYDVFETETAALAVIGDVTGHGVTAATTTSLLRHGARFASRLEPYPAAILHRLDEELRQSTASTLATALCARITPGRLALSSAGHPPALLLDTEGNVHEITTAGPLLGAFADAQWTEETVPVTAGQLVLLYTDGVTETVGKESRFGAERLKQLVRAHRNNSPAQLLDALDRALTDFRDDDAADDVAALALAPRASDGGQ